MLGAPKLAPRVTTPTLCTAGTRRLASAFSSFRMPTLLDVDKAAKAALTELSKSFPPGIKYVIAFDTTTVVGDSVEKWLRRWKKRS